MGKLHILRRYYCQQWKIFAGGRGDWGQEEASTDKRDLQEWPFQMERIKFFIKIRSLQMRAHGPYLAHPDFCQ